MLSDGGLRDPRERYATRPKPCVLDRATIARTTGR